MLVDCTVDRARTHGQVWSLLRQPVGDLFRRPSVIQELLLSESVEKGQKESAEKGQKKSNKKGKHTNHTKVLSLIIIDKDLDLSLQAQNL